MANLYASLRLPQERVHVRDASFLRRLAAFLADLLILDLVAFGAFQDLLTGAASELGAILRGAVPPAVYAASVAMALLALGYFALFEWLLGQTPGMMLLNIRAENVTLWKGFVRNLYFLPVFPLQVLWILEPLHLLWRKTRLLELVTRTRTIERIRY